MDRQVALELARQGGFGFGKMFDAAARRTRSSAADDACDHAPFDLPDCAGHRSRACRLVPSTTAFSARERQNSRALCRRVLPRSVRTESAAIGANRLPAQFVTALLPEAKAAAAALGVEPRLLLAQAALETGWGRAAPQRDGEPAHNLFGIKAGASWSRCRRGAVDAGARGRRDGAATRTASGRTATRPRASPITST